MTEESMPNVLITMDDYQEYRQAEQLPALAEYGQPVRHADHKAHGQLDWAYGVTTVPARRDNLLPRTLASLRAGGFPSPHLFVDGSNDPVSWRQEFHLEVTCRYPTLRTHGNWVLSAYELYLRNPAAHRYAVFQDDMVCSRNLRQYLERCAYPEKGYLNLYTFPENQVLCPKTPAGVDLNGWYRSNQKGKGAVALVFSRAALLLLLAHPHMIERPMSIHRGWRAVDGGIVSALKKVGWEEYVHNPSLVQHTGLASSMGNRPHQQAQSFRGEAFDCLDLLTVT